MENYELRYSVSSTNRPLTHSSISGVRPPGVVIKGYLILCKEKNPIPEIDESILKLKLYLSNPDNCTGDDY